MTSTTFFFIFIPLLAFILLAINLIFAPHNPYQEKDSAFECGFHSFLGQNRTQFSISFFIFALLFLLFDLEILLVYPYIVSAYTNTIYGLIIMLIFFLVLTLGFAFELGKNALKIDSRQMYSVVSKSTDIIASVNSSSSVYWIPSFLLMEGDFQLNVGFVSLCLIIIGLVTALLVALGLILLSGNSEQANSTQNDNMQEVPAVDPSERDQVDCTHNWQAHYVKQRCNYQHQMTETPCSLENDVNWKCAFCQQVRCGTHAQTRYPNRVDRW